MDQHRLPICKCNSELIIGRVRNKQRKSSSEQLVCNAPFLASGSYVPSEQPASVSLVAYLRQKGGIRSERHAGTPQNGIPAGETRKCASQRCLSPLNSPKIV